MCDVCCVCVVFVLRACVCDVCVIYVCVCVCVCSSLVVHTRPPQDARARGARHSDVVVWTLNRDANPREKQAFLSEISLLQRIGHANEHNMNVLV